MEKFNAALDEVKAKCKSKEDKMQETLEGMNEKFETAEQIVEATKAALLSLADKYPTMKETFPDAQSSKRRRHG